ncbi:MAG: ribonuclease Z [Marinifilaceae bacterium]|nr:ribonuclease Z [Marinifilaceae bacterium]
MKFELTILGCASAVPLKHRNCTAQVLNVLERYFLIDCGEGTQLQLRRFGIPYNKINHIFISHLHGDHFFGLIGFLSSLSMQNRKGDMHIYADKRLEKLLISQLNLMRAHLGYRLVFHHLTRERTLLYEDSVVTVESFPLKHRAEAPSCGFLFREKNRKRTIIKEAVERVGVPVSFMQYLQVGEDFRKPDGEIIPNAELTIEPPRSRSYAFVSDTLYLPEIVEHIRGVDMLYHEATYCHEYLSLAELNFHTTARQAATIAAEAGVKHLVVGHYSARYPDATPVIEEAREVFPNTDGAADGVVFEIPLEKRKFVQNNK